LAQGQNLVAQHLFQDTAMVLGHQASAAFGITPHPNGTLTDQFLYAEATNLQIGAGMALTHRFAPGIMALERGLDLSLPAADVGAGFPRPRFESPLTGEKTSPLQMGNGFQPALSTLGIPLREKTRWPDHWMMSSQDPGDKDSGGFLSWRKISSMIPVALMDREGIVRAAEENPKFVFHLSKLAQDGDGEAVSSLQKLASDRLALHAKKDPEAVFALQLLRQYGHREINRLLRELDVSILATKAVSDGKSLEALKVAAGFGTSGNPHAVSALGRLAPQNPEAVSGLYALSMSGNEEAGLFLKELETGILARQAESNPMAFLVLAYLVREGNPGALPAMAYAAQKLALHLEPLQNLAYDSVPGALEALAVAAEMNFKAVSSLEFLVSTGVKGAMEAMESAALTNIVAVEALADMGRKKIKGAVSALVRVSERNPEALASAYALTDTSDHEVAHRARRALIKGPSYQPTRLSPRLIEAFLSFESTESLKDFRNILDRIAGLAVEHPEAVYFLNDLSWNHERPVLAGMARHKMKNLEVDSLAIQAGWNPAAVFALHYLSEHKNRRAQAELQLIRPQRLLLWDDKTEALAALDLMSAEGNHSAWEALLSYDLKSMAQTSPLSSSDLFALSLLARAESPAAVDLLLRKAEAGDARAPFVLNLLVSTTGNSKIEEALPKMPVQRLTEAARTRPEAIAALSLLGQKGNFEARAALKSLDVSAYISTASSERRSLNALITLSAFGNPGAKAFFPPGSP